MRSALDELVSAALKLDRSKQLAMFSQTAARELVDRVLAGIAKRAESERVVTPIGTFRTVVHKARVTYAPRRDGASGPRREIPPQRKLKFTAAPKFRGLKP